MKTSVIVSLSAVAAALVMSGCSSSDSNKGGSSLPAWTSSKADVNVTSAAAGINELRQANEVGASPLENIGIPLAPSYADATTFDDKAAAAKALLEAKRAPKSRDAAHAAALKGPARVAAGPLSETHDCTVSGSFTITYDSGSWSDTGEFGSGTEVHNNCVDDGTTLDMYSNCAFFSPFGGDKVTTSGSCGYIYHEDDGYWDETYSYTSYKERWDDTATEDVFTISVNVEDSYKDVWTEEGDVESGTFTYTSNGYYELHGVQGPAGDGEIKLRNEAKSYSAKENYVYSYALGTDTHTDMTVNGYVGLSVSGANEDGTPIPSSGYGYYFSNLVTEDDYVDENISNFTLNGTFGSACLEGTIKLTTIQPMVNDANSIVCAGDSDAMPKAGVVTISGNGEATATFFEAVADSNNSDLNISVGDESVVYDCWGDLPECGESMPPMP